MPGTTWPVNGHPPGSSRDYPPAPVSMPANLFRHVNGYNARLPDPRLTREPGLLPHRSPRQSSANAAVGGLKPPPAGRLRRANNPSSPVQHHLKKLAYRTPFSVRDTRGSRLRPGSDATRPPRRGCWWSWLPSRHGPVKTQQGTPAEQRRDRRRSPVVAALSHRAP